MRKEDNILVTGGLGFIGSNLVDALIEQGYANITVVDNLSSDSSDITYQKGEVTYFIDDVCTVDLTKLPNKPAVIFHLAADARIQPSFKHPYETLHNNCIGTTSVCELARKTGAKVVYAGSSSFYAGPKLNPYAFSKWMSEETVLMYNTVYNIKYNIARFFNVYGDRHPKTGAHATVIGVFEECYLQQTELPVTGNGVQRRDFTHIDDIVSGLIALANTSCAGIYNLGTGINYSIVEVAKMFSNKITYISKRPGEAQNTLADISDTEKDLGWVSKVSLKEYIENFKSNNLINQQ